jgi:pyrroloquinoline quinone biosynthesis protein D
MPPLKPITAESRPALARGVRLCADPITDAPLLLYPEGALPLDEPSHDILVRCTGQLTVAEIAGALCEEYDAELQAIQADVIECLKHLRRELLVTC